MSWVRLLFNAFRVLIFLVMLVTTAVLHAQGNGNGNGWAPDYVKLQVGGGIGLIAVGTGYSFFHHRLDISGFYGIVPKGDLSVETLHSVSLQFTARPIRIPLSSAVTFYPLNAGWYLHHTFGQEYWVQLPAHYPDEYYWWSPGRNAGVFVGAEIHTPWLSSKTPASGLSFYTRLGTRGLYLASWWGNSSIPFTDIVEFGFGVALYR